MKEQETKALGTGAEYEETAEQHDRKQKVLDLIDAIARNAFTAGYAAGHKEGVKDKYEETARKAKEARAIGREELREYILSKSLIEAFDYLSWEHGDRPAIDGEYLVSVKEMPTPILLNYSKKEGWLLSEKLKYTITGFRKNLKKLEE
jgi:hypothetical protein